MHMILLSFGEFFAENPIIMPVSPIIENDQLLIRIPCVNLQSHSSAITTSNISNTTKEECNNSIEHSNIYIYTILCSIFMIVSLILLLITREYLKSNPDIKELEQMHFSCDLAVCVVGNEQILQECFCKIEAEMKKILLNKWKNIVSINIVETMCVKGEKDLEKQLEQIAIDHCGTCDIFLIVNTESEELTVEKTIILEQDNKSCSIIGIDLSDGQELNAEEVANKILQVVNLSHRRA